MIIRDLRRARPYRFDKALQRAVSRIAAQGEERLLAAELGVDWSAYDREVSSK